MSELQNVSHRWYARSTYGRTHTKSPAVPKLELMKELGGCLGKGFFSCHSACWLVQCCIAHNIHIPEIGTIREYASIMGPHAFVLQLDKSDDLSIASANAEWVAKMKQDAIEVRKKVLELFRKDEAIAPPLPTAEGIMQDKEYFEKRGLY